MERASKSKYPAYKDMDEDGFGIQQEDVQQSYAQDFGLDDIPHVRIYTDTLLMKKNTILMDRRILGLLRVHDELSGRCHRLLWLGMQTERPCFPFRCTKSFIVPMYVLPKPVQAR